MHFKAMWVEGILWKQIRLSPKNNQVKLQLSQERNPQWVDSLSRVCKSSIKVKPHFSLREAWPVKIHFGGIVDGIIRVDPVMKPISPVLFNWYLSEDGSVLKGSRKKQTSMCYFLVLRSYAHPNITVYCQCSWLFPRTWW